MIASNEEVTCTTKERHMNCDSSTHTNCIWSSLCFHQSFVLKSLSDLASRERKEEQKLPGEKAEFPFLTVKSASL